MSGWVAVFADAAHGPCAERSLVLTSLNIPHEILQEGDRYVLAVPSDVAERAKFELWQYEEENRAQQRPAPPPPMPTRDPLPGLLFYIGAIGLFAWLAADTIFGHDWLARGRIDGYALRSGELWRPFTALTLHLNLRHLVGNMVFGALFGFFAGRLAGSGVGWLAILLAAAVANGVNTLLLDPSHRSIGASTAVFAALGLSSGFVWWGKLLTQERWPYRWGPVVGGIALLAFTGTGSENTDVGAHLMGFASGFLAGMALTRLEPLLSAPRVQLGCGIAALTVLIGSWWVALS
ncbi:MAG: rhomboid family intramembrane serine protease [Pseudomonadota bacterium]